MNILVTGSSGFVGSHLCRHLLALGHAVTGFDFRIPPPEQQNFTCFQGDLSSETDLAKLPWDSVDTVFHLAAAGVKASARDWPVCVKANILGTQNLLRHLRQSDRTPTLVYAHTFYEDFIATTPALAENPYILTKYAATRAVEEFALHYPGAVVTAKLFQVYGPGDSPTNLLPYVLTQLRKGKPALLGSGKGLRDWIYIDDLVKGLIACVSGGTPAAIQRFDMGTGNLHSIRETTELLASLFFSSTTDLPSPFHSLLSFNAVPDRSDVNLIGSAKHTPSDWKPAVTLKNGLQMTINTDPL